MRTIRLLRKAMTCQDKLGTLRRITQNKEHCVLFFAGFFGNYSLPIAEQDAALLEKLNGFIAWAQEEPRMVLMNPWHYSDLGAPPNQKRVVNKNHARDGEYTLGAYAFPKLMARLRELGDQVNATRRRPRQQLL